MQNLIRISVLLLLSISLHACSSGEGPSEPSSSAVDEFVEGVARGQLTDSVAAFSQKSQDLFAATEVLCEQPSSDGLEDAREAWGEAACSWYELSLFNFGPWDADPVFPAYSFIDSLRVRGDDYRETARSSLATWLASTDTIDADFFAQQRFQYVGLLPIELLLFDDDSLASVSGEDDRSCQILVGLARELTLRAEALETAWLEGDDATGKAFVELFIEAELPSGRAPFAQLIISGKEFTEYLHSRHVAAIAGQTSGTSWELMSCAIDAVERLLIESHGGLSIVELMRKLDGAASAQAIEESLEAARAVIANEDELAFEGALAALEEHFKTDIPQVLGVDLGLTFTDGD